MGGIIGAGGNCNVNWDLDDDGVVDVANTDDWRGILAGSRVRVKFRDITDGSSNTLMFGESTAGREVNFAWMGANFIPAFWQTNQGDLNPNDAVRGDGPFAFSSFHTGGFQFALGDGSVRFISENIDETTYWTISAMASGRTAGEF